MLDQLLKDLTTHPEWFTINAEINLQEIIPISLIQSCQTYNALKASIEEQWLFCAFDLIEEKGGQLFEAYCAKYQDTYDALSEDKKNQLLATFKENVTIDLKIDPLLERTKLYLALFPDQEDNLNTEGGLLDDALNAYLEQEPVNDPTLSKLLMSQQGDPKFLESLNREIEGRLSDSSVLTFLVTLTIPEYYALKNGKQTLNFKKGKVGFYDPYRGSGSYLDLKLAHPYPIYFTGKETFDPFQFQNFHSGLDSRVQSVYHFSRWDYEASFTLSPHEWGDPLFPHLDGDDFSDDHFRIVVIK